MNNYHNCDENSTRKKSDDNPFNDLRANIVPFFAAVVDNINTSTNPVEVTLILSNKHHSLLDFFWRWVRMFRARSKEKIYQLLDLKSRTFSKLKALKSIWIVLFCIQDFKILQVYLHPCHRDTSILYMLLMFGTLWLGLFLYNFRYFFKIYFKWLMKKIGFYFLQLSFLKFLWRFIIKYF